MELEKCVSGFVFARNPITVNFNRTDLPSTGKFSIETFDGEGFVYDGRYNKPAVIDLSEVVESLVPSIPAPMSNGAAGLYIVEGEQQLACRRMSLSSAGKILFDFYALPGGLSKQNLRVFAESGDDPFAIRFFNEKANPVLTTRTSSWIIPVLETELYPFYFPIYPAPQNVWFRTPDSEQNLSPYVGNVEPGIFVADLAAVRMKHYAEENKVASVFDLWTEVKNDSFRTRFVIEQTVPSRIVCRALFRNSFGVFEIFDLSPVDMKKIFSDASEVEKGFSRYDERTAGFFRTRGRVELKTKTEITTYIPNADRYRFLLDMIISDEVYLLDVEPYPVRVVPEISEDMTVGASFDTPAPVTINFILGDDDAAMTSPINKTFDAVRPRVFAPVFDKSFN